MKATDLQFRVKSNLPVLVKQRYYDNTFLTGDDGSTVLFICDAAVVEGKRGPLLRTKRDVLQFPTERRMLEAVVAGGWKESPVDEGQWRPSLAELVSTTTPREDE